MGITFEKPNNEWLIGKYYKYNPDQDQTRKEIQRLIDSGDFVNDEDYDTDGVSLVPEDKRYKHFSDERGSREYATNAKKKTFTHQIELQDQYHTYRYKDRFKLMEQSDDEKPFMVVNLSYPKNTYRTKAVMMFPGLHEEYHSKVLLSLR